MTEKRSGKKNKKILEDLSKNYWAISTFVLAIILIVVLMTGNMGGGSGTVSANTAAQNVLSFANGQGANAQLVSVEDMGPLYQVVLSMQGQQVPVYVTKDGKKLTTNLIPLDGSNSQTNANSQTNSQPAPTNIPKSNKPIIELFVMSYCPYGTQIEKGIIPAVKVLGDKVDFNVKFVYYAMHPSQGEVEENLRQYCIEKEQKSKYLDYLTCFLEAGDSGGCLSSSGVNQAQLKTCTTRADAEFDVTKNLNDKSSWLSGQFPKFDVDKADNEKYSVGGSPTLIINGVEAQAGRDSASLLNAICGAFNTPPGECTTTQFESGQPAPGFGWEASAASNAAVAGCGI